MPPNGMRLRQKRAWRGAANRPKSCCRRFRKGGESPRFCPLDALLGRLYDRGEATPIKARSGPLMAGMNLCQQTAPIFHNDCELPAWRAAQLRRLARQASLNMPRKLETLTNLIKARLREGRQPNGLHKRRFAEDQLSKRDQNFERTKPV